MVGRVFLQIPAVISDTEFGEEIVDDSKGPTWLVWRFRI